MFTNINRKMLEILTRPIVIGRISLPLLALILIILVVCVFLYLLYLYLRETGKKDVSKPKTGKKKGKKEEEKVSREEKYKKEINKLERSLPYLEKSEADERFVQVVRSFFKSLLELDYEFTFDELSEELKKRERNKDLVSFCSKIAEVRYKKGAIPKKELQKFSKEFEKILEYEHIPEVEKIEKKGLLSKLRKASIPHISKPPLHDKQENSQDNKES